MGKLTTIDDEKKISIELVVPFEMCSTRCPHFVLESQSPYIIDSFGRGWDTFHPHCKNMFICQNAVRVANGVIGNGNKGDQRNDQEQCECD